MWPIGSSSCSQNGNSLVSLRFQREKDNQYKFNETMATALQLNQKVCAVASVQNIPFTYTKVDVANWLQQLQSEWKFTGVLTSKKEKKTTSTNLMRPWLPHWPILHAKFYIVYLSSSITSVCWFMPLSIHAMFLSLLYQKYLKVNVTDQICLLQQIHDQIFSHIYCDIPN